MHGGSVARGGKKAGGQKAVAPVPRPMPPPVHMEGSALRVLVVDTRMIGWTLVALLVLGFFWLIRDVLVTLLFVGVLTFVGAPVVARLEPRVGRTAAAGIFVVGAGLLVVALFALVLPPLVGDLAKLFAAVPALLKRVAEWAQATFQVTIPTSFSELSSEASKDILDQILPIAQGGSGIVKSGAMGVLRGAVSTAGFLGQLFLIPVLAFFVLSELPGVKALVAGLSPRGSRPLLAYYAPLIDQTLSKLLRGQLLVASLMTVIYVIGLSVAGVPFALAIAVLSGVAYLVPFASGAVCLVLSAAFALLELQGAALPPILGALVTVVVVQVVESYVLTPRIVGAEAGLSPLAAVLAVLLGGAAAGFLGVVFALPMGAVIALVLREEARRRGGLLVEDPIPSAEASP